MQPRVCSRAHLKGTGPEEGEGVRERHILEGAAGVKGGAVDGDEAVRKGDGDERLAGEEGPAADELDAARASDGEERVAIHEGAGGNSRHAHWEDGAPIAHGSGAGDGNDTDATYGFSHCKVSLDNGIGN